MKLHVSFCMKLWMCKSKSGVVRVGVLGHGGTLFGVVHPTCSMWGWGAQAHE